MLGPVVRIHYDAADVMRLLKLRRGVLVARGNTDSSARELYLQDPDGAAPLLAPYTPSSRRPILQLRFGTQSSARMGTTHPNVASLLSGTERGTCVCAGSRARDANLSCGCDGQPLAFFLAPPSQPGRLSKATFAWPRINPNLNCWTFVAGTSIS